MCFHHCCFYPRLSMTAKTTITTTTKMTTSDICKMMATFTITATMSKTEVSRVQAQFRTNPLRVMGDCTYEYCKADNLTTTMTLMITMLSTKPVNFRWAAPMEPQKDQAPVRLWQTNSQIYSPNSYAEVTCQYYCCLRRIHQGIYGNYPFSITKKIMVIYLYPFLVVITQFFSLIIMINDCISILTGSPG